MKRLLVLLIRIYQKTLSPDHGILKIFYPHGFCRYSPTCSDYCAGALQKYNLTKAISKCLWRLLRCNPFSKGGHDPI